MYKREVKFLKKAIRVLTRSYLRSVNGGYMHSATSKKIHLDELKSELCDFERLRK